ncbi:MAG: CPBP family intramembrane metalloprotease [Verrucomicrobia bacterium]|nr:CPBP family intramembrane metalloprotease [Verrucomicrobiota bacterium]MCH8512057.1 CPBP family intramembrane metalloprotease [Kiritimatiellia bacterium]
MELELPIGALIAMGLVLTFGCLGWIWIFSATEKHRRKLRDGMAWLDWRPLPMGIVFFFFTTIALGMLLNLVGIYLLAHFSRADRFADLHPLGLLIVSTFSMHVLLTVVLLWVTRTQSISLHEVPACRGSHLLTKLPQGFAGYLLAFPLVILGGILTQALLPRFGFHLEPQDLVQDLGRFESLPQKMTLFFFAVFLVPFCEELVFRGYLFPWISQRTGFWGGLVLHSLLFAWVHMNAASFLPLFALSCVLGISYVYTKSLMTAFWMHAIFNAMTLVNFFLSQGAPPS